VAPEVLARKLEALRRVLRDLEPYAGAHLDRVLERHYELERLFELLVNIASDVLFHLLAERDVSPASYRDSFRLAGVSGLVPSDFARRLEEAAGMRNVIVHLYDEIDYEILRDSIDPALADFGALLVLLQQRLEED
jgi:uncharacterized protein YutE (UPF0331/DUF86 family)